MLQRQRARLPAVPPAPAHHHCHHANAFEQRNPMGRKGTKEGSGPTTKVRTRAPCHTAARQHLSLPCRTARPLRPANAAERRRQRRHHAVATLKQRRPPASDSVCASQARPPTHHRRSPSGTKRPGRGRRGSGCPVRGHTRCLCRHRRPPGRNEGTAPRQQTSPVSSRSPNSPPRPPPPPRSLRSRKLVVHGHPHCSGVTIEPHLDDNLLAVVSVLVAWHRR